MGLLLRAGMILPGCCILNGLECVSVGDGDRLLLETRPSG